MEKSSVIDESAFSEFVPFLESSALTVKSRKMILFLCDYLRGKHPASMASRSFLFDGDPGTGKTYLVSRFLSVIDLPVLYMGTASFSHPGLVSCSSLSSVVSALTPCCVVFLDDLQFCLDYSEGDISYDSRRAMMAILDHVKSNQGCVLVCTANDVGLDSPMEDRIDVRVRMGLPSSDHKKLFLDACYPGFLSDSLSSYVASESYGYNCSNWVLYPEALLRAAKSQFEA